MVAAGIDMDNSNNIIGGLKNNIDFVIDEEINVIPPVQDLSK